MQYKLDGKGTLKVYDNRSKKEGGDGPLKAWESATDSRLWDKLVDAETSPEIEAEPDADKKKAKKEKKLKDQLKIINDMRSSIKSVKA